MFNSVIRFTNLVEEGQRTRSIALTIVLTLSLCFQFFFFFKLGARQSVDTVFYLENAHALSHGIIAGGRALWYSGFSIFLSAIFLLGGNLETVVIIQIVLAHIAAVCVYTVARNLHRDYFAGIIAAVLYLSWVPIHEWNTFVYTESLYTSLCIISFAVLLLSKNAWQYGLTSILFLFAFFIRPTGFSLIAGFIGYGIVMIPGSRYKIAFPAFLTFCTAGLLIGNTMLRSYDPVPSYALAEIIYPKIALGITPPIDLKTPSSGTLLENVFLFCLYNPVYFLKLFLIKIGLFYGNIKPYYSVLHNMMIVAFLYPLYYFAFRGFVIIREFKKERMFIAFFILANGIIVGLTTENWDGRFLVPILPFIFILSAGSIARLITSFGGRKNKIHQLDLSR